MNEERSFERFVANNVAGQNSGIPLPDDFYDDMHSFATTTRQRPQWLAFIKEPPMRTNSHLAVGSPTVRVAAIMVATLLLVAGLAAAGSGAQRLLAADGEIVVDQSGKGDYTTIIEAVAAAEDGDEISVKPGTYVGAVLIDKDIVLRGDGSREEVILEFIQDGPTVPAWDGAVPYGLLLVDTQATVSDLTVLGPNVGVAFVFVGGEPTLERVSSELMGEYSGRAHASIGVQHGAGGTVRESLLDGPVLDLGGAQIPEYEGITGSGRFIAEDNVLDTGFGFDVTDGSSFVRNTITDDGIIELALIGDGSVLIARNDVSSILLLDQTDGFTVRDNTVHSTSYAETGANDGNIGIDVGTGAPIIEGNTIADVPIGIFVPEGASPTITGNHLERMKSGIAVVDTDSATVIEDNQFCDNERDLVVPAGSTLSLDSSNEVCDDTAEG